MRPVVPGVTSARGTALVEVFRAALARLEHLAPAEQDAIVSAIVADLRMRRPMTFASLGVRGEPAPPSTDPRGRP